MAAGVPTGAPSSDGERASAPPPARKPSGRRRLLWCAASLLLGLLAFEGLLRVLVYTDVAWGEAWRDPQRYADRRGDPFYFQLSRRLTGDPGPLPARLADARLGWVHEGMERTDFDGRFEARLAGRRPLLLFGASFVRCMTGATDCYEGWMERSSAGQDYAVLNYGVRGYGIDQTAMLVRLALPRWRGRNALVAIGIFVEDDLDRTILDFRGWPKPRFRLGPDGALVEPGPVPTDAEYAEAHPLWPHSLAWGWLVHGSNLLPASVQRRLAGTRTKLGEKRRLSEALLDRLERDLQEAGVEHFYVLFPSALDCQLLEGGSWQEQFLLDWLAARKLAFVNVRRDLLQAALEQDLHPTAFFGARTLLPEHLTPQGNEIAFRALLRGVQGAFDHGAGRRAPHPFEIHVLEGSDPACASYELGWTARFPDAADRERLTMRPTAEAPARVGCTFSFPARRFLATAKLCAPAGGTGDAPVRLEIRVDDDVVFDAVLDAEHPSAEIDLDVFDKRKLKLVATRPDPARASGNSLVLARPRFD